MPIHIAQEIALGEPTAMHASPADMCNLINYTYRDGSPQDLLLQ